MRANRVLLLAGVLTLPMMAGIGVSWADEEAPKAAEPAGPASSMLLGRITAVEGDVLQVQEEGEESIRVALTQETMTPGGSRSFKVGDWVIASVLPDGKAVAMNLLIERGGGAPLEAATSPIERTEER